MKVIEIGCHLINAAHVAYVFREGPELTIALDTGEELGWTLPSEGRAILAVEGIKEMMTREPRSAVNLDALLDPAE